MKRMIHGFWAGFALLALLAWPVHAEDRKAVLDDGAVVILHDDGTWEFESSVLKPVAGEFDFRAIRWGMRKPEVIRQEAGEYIVQDDSLVYEVTLLDIPVLLLYNFSGEVLVGAGYLLNETLCGVTIDAAQYLRFKELLSEKYGPMRELPDSYDFFKPKYSLTGYWETEQTRILLVGGNGQIGIFYESRAEETVGDESGTRDL